MPISEKPRSVVAVNLSIRSRDFTPSQIAQHLGLEPTGTLLMGTEVLSGLAEQKEVFPEGHPPLRYPWHVFKLEVTRQSFEDDPLASAKLLETVLDELLQKVEPVAERLHSLRDRTSAEVACACYSRDYHGWFTLSGPLLRRIAALGLSMRVLLARLEGKE